MNFDDLTKEEYEISASLRHKSRMEVDEIIAEYTAAIAESEEE